MFRKQHKYGPNLTFKGVSVTDIKAFFEKQGSVTPTLVKYRKCSSTSRSSEDITLGPYNLPTSSSSCPTTPQPTYKMSKGIIAGISSISKAAGDMVGLSPSASSASTVTLTEDPKATAEGGARIKTYKQSTLKLTTNNPINPSGKKANPPAKPPALASRAIVNSYLTQSLADTPQSDHGSWAQDDEHNILISMGNDGDSLEEFGGGLYTAPSTTAASTVNNVMLQDLQQQKRGEDMTMEVSTPGGTKRPLPKPGQNNSSEDEDSLATPPTVGKKQRNQGDEASRPRPPFPAVHTEGMPQQFSQLAAALQQLQADHQQTQAELARMKREFDLQSSEQVSVYHNLTEAVTKLKVGHTEHTDRIDGALESVESLGTRMDDMEKDVGSIRHSVAKLTSTQEEMVAELKRMGAQLNDGAPSPQGDQSTSMFIGGLHSLRRWRNDQESDPLELVGGLLEHLCIYYFMERMSIADNAARESGDRRAARAVIVVMRSTHHRREAIIKLKRWLNDMRQDGLEGVTVGDCFPAPVVHRARTLGKFAIAKKREGHFHRFRVINRRGEAILQISEKGKAFYDCDPTEEDLAEYDNRSEKTRGQEMDTDETPEATTALHTGGLGGRGGRGKPTSGANSQRLGTRPNKPSNKPGTQQPPRSRTPASNQPPPSLQTPDHSHKGNQQPNRPNSRGGGATGGSRGWEKSKPTANDSGDWPPLHPPQKPLARDG